MPKITVTYQFEDEDEMRAHFGGEVRSVIAPAPVAEPERSAPAPVAAPVAEEEDDSDTDADGMPYDPDIHSTPKAKTAEGIWRAKRGKAPEAAAARADFKASGGNVTPPEVEEEEVEVEKTAPQMPAMFGAAKAVAAPVDRDTVVSKAIDLVERGIVADFQGLCASIGLTDPNVIDTNETMRAALYAKLVEAEAAA